MRFGTGTDYPFRCDLGQVEKRRKQNVLLYLHVKILVNIKENYKNGIKGVKIYEYRDRYRRYYHRYI